jgi:hypothetical protein
MKAPIAAPQIVAMSTRRAADSFVLRVGVKIGAFACSAVDYISIASAQMAFHLSRIEFLSCHRGAVTSRDRHSSIL